jgi:large subunit ribosomal protein L22
MSVTYYSANTSDPAKTARAYGRDLDCSPKSGRNVARAIKGMNVEAAKAYLNDVLELKVPVKFTVRMRKIHHRKGQGFGPGKYPVGTVSRMLKVLESDQANAEYKGLDKDSLVITHATAYQGTVTQAFTPRAMGRATAHYNRKCNFEVIVTQVEADAKTEETKSTKAKPAKGKAAAKKSDAKHTEEKTKSAAKASDATTQTKIQETA